MMRVPGFNPLAPIGEGFARGFEPGLEQGLQRGMMQSGLSKAEQLMNQPGVSPTSAFFTLAKAFAGIPGGMQMLAETYPLLMNQLQANMYPGSVGAAGPQGYNHGVAAALGMGQKPQAQTAPNVMYGQRPQQAPQQPQTPAQQLLNQPQQNQAPFNVEPTNPSALSRFNQGNRAAPWQIQNQFVGNQEDFDRMVKQLAPLLGIKGAQDVASQRQQAQLTPQEAEISRKQAEKGLEKATYANESEKNSFLEHKLEQDGWLQKGQQGQSISKDPFIASMAHRLFERYTADPNVKLEQAWQETRRNINRASEAKTNMQHDVTPRSYTAFINPSGYKQDLNYAKQQSRDFLVNTGGYDPKTKQYDLETLGEARNILASAGWRPEEQREATTPTSSTTRKWIESLPNPSISRMSYNTLGTLGASSISPEFLNKNIEAEDSSMAKGLVENLQPWDSLLAIKSMFFNKGYLDGDFSRILSKARQMGLMLSEYQKDELSQVQRPMYPGLQHIYEGNRSFSELLKAPKL